MKKTYKKIEEKLTSEGTELRQRVAELEKLDTTHKQAEQPLGKAEEGKLTILNSISEHVVLQDMEHRVIWANKAAGKSVNLPPEQLVGQYCYEIWPQRDTPCVGCPVAKARQTGKPQKAEITTPDGRMWSIRGYPILDEYDRVTGVLEVALDITERKKAEQALADEATRRCILIDQSRDGIVVLDQNGKVYEANQQFAEMLGYTPEETAQLHVWDWEYLYPRERVLEMIRTVDEAGDRFETQHRRKDGTTYDVEISTNGAMCAGQKLIFCVSRDITERKQAEETLQTEKNKLQSLIDAMEDGLNILDKDYNIIFQNELARRLYGARLGEKCYRVYAGRETVCDGCPVKKAFKDGKSHTSERKLLAPSGEVAYWEATANPIRDAGGNIASCLEIARNITERKQAEEALRQSEKKYKNMVEATSDMIWEANEKGTFTFVSPRIKDILGYEASEVIGKTRTLDLTKKAEMQKWLKRFKEINAKKESFFGFEITHLHKNGTPVLFEISGIPTFDNAGNFKVYVGVNKDITDRKQAEEALRESKEFSSSLLESSPNPIFVINPDTSIKYVNPALEKLTGFTLAEITGLKAPYPWWPEELRKKTTAAFKNALLTGSRTSERTFQKKNGEHFWVVLNSAPVMHEGKLIHFLVNWVDITERQQAEEREQELQRELYLSSRLASIGELAAGVAHQLNNPLTGVLGFSQRLLRKSTDQETNQDLKRIYTEAERAAKVVQNLLTFARRRQTQKQYSDINEILESALELRAYELTTSNIEVVTDLAPKLPEVMLDFYQIQEVFLNIILNAEQAMTDANSGGKLTIKTEERKAYIRTTFTDNGPGIPAENLEKVFDPFFSTKGEKGGTGLGLSVCHGIISEHGGRIYAKSKPGKGATFFVELPLVRMD